MRDLARTTARLTASGFQPLLQKLLDGLAEPEELAFGSLVTAKAIMKDLYNFLWFYPEAKAKVSLRLNTTTGVLLLMPRGVSEKRGRRSR